MLSIYQQSLDIMKKDADRRNAEYDARQKEDEEYSRKRTRSVNNVVYDDRTYIANNRDIRD